MNNVRDMINMQNHLWWGFTNGVWTPSECLFNGQKERQYMGWNEIPVDRITVDNPLNWDTFLIKLPANLCGKGGSDDTLECLPHDHQKRLVSRIEQYIKNGLLVLGSDYITTRPGSYTVVAREYKDQSGNYFHTFFCESWTSPLTVPLVQPMYKLNFVKKSPSNEHGACYLSDIW